MLIGAGLTTIIILQTRLSAPFFFVFRRMLPSAININVLSAQLEQGHSIPPFQWFLGMFFGAGLMEELLKAIPVLLALYLGRRLQSPQHEQIGVWEPLDGILLGAASAVGFTLLETLEQYVPNVTADAGETVGIMLVVPRILGSIAGHIAYSGYFDYFIGLSVLKPRKRWCILGIGCLTSATIHALWNSIDRVAQTEQAAIFLLCLVGVTAYVLLMAAIVNARRISPTRSQNFATQFYPGRPL